MPNLKPWHKYYGTGCLKMSFTSLLSQLQNKCSRFTSIEQSLNPWVSDNLLIGMCHAHTCQVGKVQKREISLFASYQRGRFCGKPFCDINFVHQHSNYGWNFENDEIFPPYNGLKPIIWCITCYYCTLWILCWLSNAFSLQNSIQFTLFTEKMIGRKWGSKRGRFPLLGGRWMFGREMGSKRRSLSLKRETWHVCMHYQSYSGGLNEWMHKQTNE